MSAEDLLPLLNAIHFQTLFIGFLVFLVVMLTLVEVIRLVIVIKRSVKGRMDHVRSDY